LGETIRTRLLIVGSGPAGYTAAIYAARAMLEPVLVAGIQPGGQMTITTDVENYPGFADVIQGPWLMEQMRLQAEHVGTRMIADHIVAADLSRRPFTLKGDSGDTISLRGQVSNVLRQLEQIVDAANSVVVTGAVHQIVQGYFDCESIGEHRLRGMSDGVELLRVLKKRAVRSRVEVGDPTDLTPLVGRDREVGLLEDRWEQAVDGMGQVVLLIGEAGLGKSRLVHMLKQKVDADASDSRIPVIEWRCSPHHQNSSFSPNALNASSASRSARRTKNG